MSSQYRKYRKYSRPRVLSSGSGLSDDEFSDFYEQLELEHELQNAFLAGEPVPVPPGRERVSRRGSDPFNSNSLGKYDRLAPCPHSKGSVKVLKAYYLPLSTSYIAYWINKTCKKWGCPVCRVRNWNILMKRVFGGALFREVDRLLSEGKKYCLKFLTLTVPGDDYRQTHTPAEALADIWSNWRKLCKALQAKYGKFMYFSVIEYLHGYPHMHVYLVGESIQPKSVLDSITKLWCSKYGMGYVRLQARVRVFDPRSRSYSFIEPKYPKRVLYYVMKYMGKDRPLVDDYQHIYSHSDGALCPIEDLSSDSGVILYIQSCAHTIQSFDSSYESDFFSIETFSLSEVQGWLDSFFDPVIYACAWPKQSSDAYDSGKALNPLVRPGLPLTPENEAFFSGRQAAYPDALLPRLKGSYSGPDCDDFECLSKGGESSCRGYLSRCSKTRAILATQDAYNRRLLCPF